MTDWVERRGTFTYSLDRLEKTDWEVKEDNSPYSRAYP